MDSKLNSLLAEEERKRELGEQICRFRERLGLSKRGLAKRLGVNASSIMRVENGYSQPKSRAELERYSIALELDQSERLQILEKGGYVFRVYSPGRLVVDENKYFWLELLETASLLFHIEGKIGQAKLLLQHIIKNVHESSDKDLSFVRSKALLIMSWISHAQGESKSVLSVMRLLYEAEAIAANIG